MPQCDKVLAVNKESQKIGEFLEWAEREGLVELHQRIDVMLAKYFDIDLDEVERERRMLLTCIRVDRNMERGK